MRKVSGLCAGLLAVALATPAMAQDGYNKYSYRPIHESDIMWKKTVWRTIDLRELQNEPFYSENREITQVIIDAALRGDVQAYHNDSLEEGKPLTIEELQKRLIVPGTGSTFSYDDPLAGDPAAGEDPYASDPYYDDPYYDDPYATEGDDPALDDPFAEFDGGTDMTITMGPKDLYLLNIKEDVIFDKQRSRVYYDIQALSIIFPMDHPDNIEGKEVEVASFKFVELADKLFATHPDAIWYNPYNETEHRTLLDAFELRLFASHITRVSNPRNRWLADYFPGDPQRGVMASQWKEFELMEFEHNLWEF